MIRKRKGVTLAEMSIVMAVIAIVSLSVVSFVTITSGRGTNSVAKLNAMEELELVESFVDQWFEAVAMKENGSIITIGDGTGDNSRVLCGNVAQLSLRNYVLKIEFPGAGNYSTYNFEKVEKLFFDYKASESGDDILYFCTVTYEQEEDGTEQTYTFCINPRIGEIIGETPNENTGGETGEGIGEGTGQSDTDPQ